MNINHARQIHDTVQSPASDQLAVSNEDAVILAEFIKYVSKSSDVHPINKQN